MVISRGIKRKHWPEMGLAITKVTFTCLKPNNRNTRIKCEMCSKLTIKTPEQRHSSVSIVDFEQLNVSWVMTNVPIMQKLVN